MTKKLNLTKKYKTYYAAKATPQVVEFGEVHFVSIEGKGDPTEKAFQAAIDVLYTVAYGVKKSCKNQDKDFVVSKLEGLWWAESGRFFLDVSRSEWKWKLLIRMPNFVTTEIFVNAKREALAKKGLALIKKVNFEVIDEGKCVQIMHIGPYKKEVETIRKMKTFMKEKGYVENGLHHEIYISDPRKTAPEKLKTIIRQPVK